MRSIIAAGGADSLTAAVALSLLGSATVPPHPRTIPPNIAEAPLKGGKLQVWRKPPETRYVDVFSDDPKVKGVVAHGIVRRAVRPPAGNPGRQVLRWLKPS